MGRRGAITKTHQVPGTNGGRPTQQIDSLAERKKGRNPATASFFAVPSRGGGGRRKEEEEDEEEEEEEEEEGEEKIAE